MWRKLMPVLAIGLLYGASYPLYRSLTASFARKTDPDILYLPRSGALRSLKLGWESVLSDVLWLRAIGYIQAQLDLPRGVKRWRQLQALYEAITNFDPYFVDGYRYGSIFLSVLARNQDAAMAMLKKGLAVPEIRNRWELNYDLGALYFLEKKDFERAADYFRLAALDPRAPDFVPYVASYFLRYTQKEHGIAVALSIWRQRLTNKNEEVRKLAKQEIARLTVQQERERHLNTLRRAAEMFKAIEGRWPSTIEELAKPGILGKLPEKEATDLFMRTMGRPPKDRAEMLSLGVLQKLPQEPTGGRYLIDSKTGVVSYKEDPKNMERIIRKALEAK